MTEEELKRIEEMEVLLENNGFKINSAFVISSLSFEEIATSVDRLNNLKAKINEGVDIRNFTKTFSLDINKIDEVVKKDLYFQNNIGARDFLDTLGLLQEKIAFSTSYVRAEEILNERLEVRKDIMNRIALLDEDLTLSEKEKNHNSLILSHGRRNVENAIKDSKKFLNEQRILYEESLKAFNGREFQEELLATINKLDSDARKLSMEPSNMDELSSIIRNARDKVVLLGHEFGKIEEFQKQYDVLCEKCGIAESKENERKNTVEPTREPVVEPIVSEKQKEIKDLNDLVSEVQRLNPDVKMSFENDTLTVEDVEDLSTLKLPEGFKYDENLGINNKVDDLTPYLSLPVTKKERVLDVDPTPKKPTPINPTPVNEELNDEELVEPKKQGKRYKVKKTRKAILAPYVYSTLTYAGLGSLCALCASVGLGPVVPVALVGAGIGALGQKIYNSMAASGLVDKEHAKERKTDESFQEKTWTMAGLTGIANAVKKKSKELFNILKYGREVSEPTKEQEIPALEEHLEPVFEEQKEEALNENSLNVQENETPEFINEEEIKQQVASVVNDTMPNVNTSSNETLSQEDKDRLYREQLMFSLNNLNEEYELGETRGGR